jgi:hypothetical protein
LDAAHGAVEVLRAGACGACDVWIDEALACGGDEVVEA